MLQRESVPRSSKKGLILKGRLARVVFQKFALGFKEDRNSVGSVKLEKTDYPDLFDVITSDLTHTHVKKLKCLMALSQGKDLEQVAREFNVTTLFLASLLGRLKRDGFKQAILKKSCPTGITNQRKIYEDAIRTVSCQPLPAGCGSWNRDALALAIKLYLGLELRPDLRLITLLLKNIDFVKWKGRYMHRQEIK